MFKNIKTADELVQEKLKQEEIGKNLEIKSKRMTLLNRLVVEVNTKKFDGNESARANMMSAIMSAETVGQTEAPWKLADNTVAVVTISELKEALALSIQEVGNIVMGAYDAQ